MNKQEIILFTGRAGFIGINFVIERLTQSDDPVININKLNYVSNLEKLTSLLGYVRYLLVKADLRDRVLVSFAPDSHVDQCSNCLN
jgi:dTDP-glucose 4,6-dehydratase